MTSQTHSVLLSSTWLGCLTDVQGAGFPGLDIYAQAGIVENGFVMPVEGKPACERRNNSINTQVVAT